MGWQGGRHLGAVDKCVLGEWWSTSANTTTSPCVCVLKNKAYILGFFKILLMFRKPFHYWSCVFRFWSLLFEKQRDQKPSHSHMEMEAGYLSFGADGSLLTASPAPTDLLRPMVWMTAETVFMRKWDPWLLWTTQSCLPLMARSQGKPVWFSPAASHTLLVCEADKMGHLWDRTRFTVKRQLWLAARYFGSWGGLI